MKKKDIDGAAFSIKTKTPVADAITTNYLNQINSSFKRKLEKRTSFYENIYLEKNKSF